MLKNLVSITFILILAGCASASKNPLPIDSFVMTSQDPSYGFTKDKPIELGGFLLGTKYEGAHIEYFQSLLGPNGEEVEVRRLGSCCSFEDQNLPFGGGLLDIYELTYEGLSNPVIIYVNLYKFIQPMAPKGFVLF